MLLIITFLPIWKGVCGGNELVGLKLSSASEPSCLVPHLFLKTLCLSGQKAQAGWKAKSQFTFSCSICPFPWM
uniref:Uncharacterized protein n=1 Tax=Mus musculus TaxID=10090 RepID=Q6R5C7_MOUSE|nr:unknown [Mus musculus]